MVIIIVLTSDEQSQQQLMTWRQCEAGRVVRVVMVTGTQVFCFFFKCMLPSAARRHAFSDVRIPATVNMVLRNTTPPLPTATPAAEN